MTQKSIVLITTSLMVEMPHPIELEELEEHVVSLSNELVQYLKEFADQRKEVTATEVTTFRHLDDQWENAERCSECDRWATDVNKANPIDGIGEGVEIGGRLICNECRSFMDG